MSESKPNESFLLRTLRARRGTLTALTLLAAFGMATKFAWSIWGERVATSPRYRVTPASVQITPPPEWVRGDLVAAAFAREPLASGMSILDPPEQLEEPLVASLEAQPWVRRVIDVQKVSPNRVLMQVEYRSPLAAVRVANALTPTDQDGVRLPAEDISSAYLQQLPRIVYASGDVTKPGTRPIPADDWPGAQIAGAASIVAAFGEAFTVADLIEVQIALPGVRAGERFDTYQLRSSGNTLVLWGAAPGAGPPDEASFEAKLERLRQSITRYGPLDSVEKSPAVIDVRNGVDAFRRVVLRDKNRLAAKPEEAEVK